MAQKLSQGRWQLHRHLNELSIILALAVAGRYPRLIINMPPQHGKSQLVSHWFPTWFLDLFPWLNVLLVSYEADYAARWGRNVRNTIQSNQDKLRVRISQDSSAADNWTTTAGGGMSTAGVGGAVTGKPAHVLILDDPHKNREQAESETYREKVWDFFSGTARERVNPMPWAKFGVIVVMMTRWHTDDLAGRLVSRKVDPELQAYSLPWTVYKLPAIALENDNDPLGRKTGEALWPERYPFEVLMSIKADISLYDWEAEYQQSPVRREGALFRREWFWPVEVL